MHQYYEALELQRGASETEIKKSYRRLARKYHPDVNQAPDAEQRFINITEAYENLLNGYKVPQFTFEEFQSSEVAEVVDKEAARRQRAKEYARRRYEEFHREIRNFKNAWYYVPLKIIRYVVVYVLYAIALAMILAPFVAMFTSSLGVVIGFAFLAIISSQVYVLARTIYKGTEDYFS